MKKTYPIILSALFLAASCSKGDNPGCEECFEGEVTCLINGEEWKAKCESGLFGCTPYQCRYDHLNTKQFSLIAGRQTDHYSFIQLVVSSSTGGAMTGINKISIITSGYGNAQDSCGRFRTDSSAKRELYILSIDTINRIIEGDFNYTAVGECGKVVEITAG